MMGLEEMISAIISRPLDKSKCLFELKETKGFVSHFDRVEIMLTLSWSNILSKNSVLVLKKMKGTIEFLFFYKN